MGIKIHVLIIYEHPFIISTSYLLSKDKDKKKNKIIMATWEDMDFSNLDSEEAKN